MKRGGPLRRRTPLRGTAARTRLAGRRKADRWAYLRHAVFVRDGGQCVRCGVNLHAAAWECHHRQLRSQGGPDALFNLVALCGSDHRWAHDRRTESEPLGLIVPSHADPATTPVTYFDGSCRLLTEKEAA